MAGRSQRRVVMAVTAIVVTIMLALVFRRDIGTWYVARAIRLADTPEEELKAFVRMNHWGHVHTHGYRVEAEDADGNSIRPWETGQYDRVAAVTITWGNGTMARKAITHNNSLSYVFGE